MNLAQAAELILLFKLNDQVSGGLKTIQGELGRTEASTASLTGGLGKVQAGLQTGFANALKIGAAGVGLLASQVMSGLDSIAELQDVTLQTNAVIESTGGVAGITAEEVRGLAEEYENLTGVDDKVIQSGENLLLTFTNIREDAFEPALAASLDLSAGLEQDLSSSITMVGKALNDPIAGLTALGRAGVQFSEEQKELIKTLVETGDVAGAQAVILEELNTQFGGSAQADMAGYRGSVTRLKDAWEDVQMTLAEKVAPAIGKIVDKLDEFVRSDKFMGFIEDIGDGLADLFSDENIDKGFGALEEAFTFLRDLPWEAIRSGISLTADAAKKAVDVFKSLPPGVQAGLITFLAANKLTGGLVASGLGELAKVALTSLRTITAANVTVIGANVTGPGVTPVPTGGTSSASLLAMLGGLGVIAGIVTAVLPRVNVSEGGVSPTELNSRLLIPLGGIQENTETAQQVLPTMDQNLRLQAGWAAGIYDIIQRTGPNLFSLPTIAELSGQTRSNTGETATNTQNIAANTNGIAGGFANVREQLGAGGAIAGGLRAEHQLSGRQLERLTRLSQLQDRGVQLSDRQLARLDRLQNIANAQDAKLESIKGSSNRTANKDFSVDVKVATTLNVSAREIASVIRRWTDLRGENEFG